MRRYAMGASMPLVPHYGVPEWAILVEQKSVVVAVIDLRTNTVAVNTERDSTHFNRLIEEVNLWRATSGLACLTFVDRRLVRAPTPQ